MSAPDLLADLDGVFARLGLRWYVFGAQAVVALGRPRMTADVDVTVELGTLSLEELLPELLGAGFEPVFELDAEFVATTRVVPLRHSATEMPVDVVLAGPGLEELFLDRAVVMDLGGASVPVIAPEHLVVTKILAGRPQDLEDVRGLLASGRSLDTGEVDSILADLEAALGQSDLLPRWEAVRRG